MKNLKPFKVNEGDWWDNDPSAPWNQPDPPEPEARIEYSENERLFKLLTIASDSALLKKKADGSIWILDITDVEYDEGCTDYLYFYDVDEDTKERYEGMEDEEYGSLATDLFKENKWTEGKEAWEDRGGEMRLFKIDLGLAEELIHDFVKYSKPRAGATWRPSPAQMKANRLGASILSKAFPEAED
jgi:hypothetical protein